MSESGRDAFTELVTPELPGLLRAAYLLTGDAGLAEDLLQNALTNAYLAKSRVLRADTPSAYLRTILVNAHRRSHRRHRVAEVLTDDVPDRPMTAGVSDDRRDLVAAVADLPPRQRAVVVLRYLEDRSEAEVAKILGCSVGTVKSQGARAIVHLRRHPALADADVLTSREAAHERR